MEQHTQMFHISLSPKQAVFFFLSIPKQADYITLFYNSNSNQQQIF